MKAKMRFLLGVLFLIILVACTQANSERTINPGDKIGNFLITTGVDEELVYMWVLNNYVQQREEEIYSIELPVSTKMNVSVGVYSEDGTPLDELWEEHTYKMFINDRHFRNQFSLQAIGLFVRPQVISVAEYQSGKLAERWITEHPAVGNLLFIKKIIIVLCAAWIA